MNGRASLALIVFAGNAATDMIASRYGATSPKQCRLNSRHAATGNAKG